MSTRFYPIKDSVREAFKYALGTKHSDGTFRNVLPTLLRGDPELITKLCEHLPFKRPYASSSTGFTSFVSATTEEAVCDRITECMAPGLEDRIAVAFIRHTEPDSQHIHSIGANVNLQTGRQLTLFWHESDIPLFNSGYRVLAFEHGLSDPDEPYRARLIPHPPRRIRAAATAAYANISSLIETPVRVGELRNRDEVLKYLQRHGHAISKVHQDGVRIEKGPKVDLDLVGGVFASYWKPGIGTWEQRNTEQRLWIQTAEVRYACNLALFLALRDRKATRLRGRHLSSGQYLSKEATVSTWRERGHFASFHTPLKPFVIQHEDMSWTQSIPSPSSSGSVMNDTKPILKKPTGLREGDSLRM